MFSSLNIVVLFLYNKYLLLQYNNKPTELRVVKKIMTCDDSTFDDQNEYVSSRR